MTALRTVSRYLAENFRSIKHIRSVRVLDEGALRVEVVHPRYHDDIMIYVLAGELSVGFIKRTLNTNTNVDRHTVYIVSLDLITHDGKTAVMSDALLLLLHAFGDKVYVYTDTRGEFGIFPVEVTTSGMLVVGQPVNLAHLSGDYATFNNKHILGVRKIAAFMQRDPHINVEPVVDEAVLPFYDLLEVPPSATLEQIKLAYRRKARQHHPDTDKSPGATERMQLINDAYAHILEQFNDYS